MSHFDPPDDADRYDTDPRSRTLSRAEADVLKARANPRCAICLAEGFYVLWRDGDRDAAEDVPCPCTDDRAVWRQKEAS